MNVLVIEPGHGSLWLEHAVYVDRFGKPNPRGRFVRGDTWEYDGGWNMPDDYRGQYEPYTTPRKLILKIESAPLDDVREPDRDSLADLFRAAPDLELMEDGRKWRAAEAEGHVVTFTKTGYGLTHPPSCRPDLIGCPYNRHLADLDKPARPPGRYRMSWGRVGEPSPAYESLR